MNKNRRPIVGIVAQSNAWDKPGTIRLVHVEGYGPRYLESVTTIARIVKFTIVGDAKGANSPENLPSPSSLKTFEIKGSKDNVYVVKLDGSKFSCTCTAGIYGRLCKHVKAARELQEAEA